MQTPGGDVWISSFSGRVGNKPRSVVSHQPCKYGLRIPRDTVSGSCSRSAVGGYAAQYKGWRWTQWSMLFLGGAIWIYSLWISETYTKIILVKRAKKLGLPPPPKGPNGLASVKLLLTVTVTRSIYMLLTEPIVGIVLFVYGLQFCCPVLLLRCIPLSSSKASIVSP